MTSIIAKLAKLEREQKKAKAKQKEHKADLETVKVELVTVKAKHTKLKAKHKAELDTVKAELETVNAKHTKLRADHENVKSELETVCLNLWMSEEFLRVREAVGRFDKASVRHIWGEKNIPTPHLWVLLSILENQEMSETLKKLNGQQVKEKFEKLSKEKRLAISSRTADLKGALAQALKNAPAQAFTNAEKKELKDMNVDVLTAMTNCSRKVRACTMC